MHYIVIIVMAVVTFISQIMTRSVSVVFEVLTRKLLLIGAVLTALASLVGAFYFAISSVISSISVSAPPMLSQAASLVVPDNFISLVTIQITARLIRFAYEWNVKVLQWRL